MTPLLENAKLTTNLDGRYHNLLNVGALLPVPIGLVSTDDPRLSDARNPLPGSVIDASVAAGAAIVQSKLNLNGLIPTGWLGTTSTTAAQGNLAEYRFYKDQPNGYASLDGTGKLPVSELPTGVGLGTITSIGITMPAQFSVTGSPVTTTGTVAVSWLNVADGSWFGNVSGSSGPPIFNTTPIPVSLVPALDASQITTGVFIPARIPLCVGVGASHAPGAAPDPGATGNVLDYLARDMTYRPIPTFGPGYQPTVPDPVMVIDVGTPPYLVDITSTLDGASLFYSVNQPNSNFLPVPDTGQITLQTGQTAYAYGSKTGYTNSHIVFISAPTAPPGETVSTGDPLNPTELVYGDDAQPVTVGP